MSLILLAQKPLGTIEGSGKFLPDATKSGGSQIEAIITMAVGFLTIVAGLAFLIYFLLGAITWVTAGGNEKKAEDAKGYMTNGAIGLIIVVAAYGVVWIVGEVLGLKILDPASTLDLITPKGGQ